MTQYIAYMISQQLGTNNTVVTACMVEAATDDEALGKATRIAHKIWPSKVYWHHRVWINSNLHPMTPENVEAVFDG